MRDLLRTNYLCRVRISKVVLSTSLGFEGFLDLIYVFMLRNVPLLDHAECSFHPPFPLPSEKTNISMVIIAAHNESRMNFPRLPY